MKRIALGIEYDGTDFRGWQKQPNVKATVQALLESAIAHVADESIAVICAGRTDAGVHASGQVIHFDTSRTRPIRAWVAGVNYHLPPQIRVQWAQEMTTEFHARFSALARTYRYGIIIKSVAPALWRNFFAWSDRSLQVQMMQEASLCFLGEHDFESFRAGDCQAKTAIRTVHELSIEASEVLIQITIKANAFLHHMVRKIVGVLWEIGAERQPISWAQDVLSARQRGMNSALAPARGLHLTAVDYPETFAIPKSIYHFESLKLAI